MSYNISQWKTKKIENLVIPIKAFYKGERQDWHPNTPETLNGTTTIEDCGEGFYIEGYLEGDDLLHIDEIENYGECSGSFMRYTLDSALEESTGYLEAVLVWEGGDSITRYIVNNGVVTNETIE